jgi:hypothetical protein
MLFRTDREAGWQTGTTVNISRTGILFKAGETLGEDALLDVRLQFPNDVSISCKGTVVRSESSKFAVRMRHPRISKRRPN